LRSFKLISTTGDQTIDLTVGESVIVGRAVTSDFPIYDPTVSRQHAEVVLDDEGVRVKDFGSSNGTFVNGAQVTETSVVDGDMVTFGRIAFKVVEVTPPDAKPAAPEPMDFAPPAPDATIVKQIVVPGSGGFEAQPEDSPSAAQLQVDG
jgi:pSer/pThr/pTyr-binding forkhead associated (FHA) protein